MRPGLHAVLGGPGWSTAQPCLVQERFRTDVESDLDFHSESDFGPEVEPDLDPGFESGLESDSESDSESGFESFFSRILGRILSLILSLIFEVGRALSILLRPEKTE